jgi:hypothetical protein
MRSYAGFTQEEKEQVYSLARAGVPDEVNYTWFQTCQCQIQR